MANIEAHEARGAAEYLFGPFRFVPARRTLFCGDVPQHLGGRAIDILAALLERPNEPIGKRELIQRVWPHSVVEDNNLKVHVAALRRTLGTCEQGLPYIATVSGRGYCFVAPVSAAGAPAPLGRDAVVTALAELLRQRRLLSIVGPGGIGKSTVALALAESCAARHGLEACIVDLGQIADQERMRSVVAGAAGLGPRAAASDAALVDALRNARILLVLDNCDHVIDATAVLAGELGAGAPGVRIVCTSREPLRADGEHVHRLAALEVPAPGMVRTAVEALAYPAVRLFAERAAAALDGFRLLDADVGAVVEVCRRLEGNALGIELAATRIDAFGPRELAARLDDRFRLLERGHRSVQARHRTLADSLDWSYDHLPESQRMLLRAVSVFAGPFTVDAAAALCQEGGRGGPDVASGLADLVAKSMLSGAARAALSYYRMADVTKAYALDKLEACGEAARYRRRHAQLVGAALQRAAREWGAGRGGDWIADRGAGIEDVRSALAWSMSPQGDRATGIMLTVAAIPLWTHLSLREEGRMRVALALAAGARHGFPAPWHEASLRAALAGTARSDRTLPAGADGGPARIGWPARPYRGKVADPAVGA